MTSFMEFCSTVLCFVSVHVSGLEWILAYSPAVLIALSGRMSESAKLVLEL